MATWRDIDDLQLWERNYNNSSVSRLKAAFKKFGFNGALRVWNGTVMGGNHSLMALRELRTEGWQPIGGGLKADKGKWLVDTVDTSHLDSAAAEAAAIADNWLPTKASPDFAAMTDLMKGIATADNTLLEVVFTPDELAEFENLALLAEGLSAELDAAPGSDGKRVGLERAKQVKVVIAVADLPTIERAIDATGEVNRGSALLKVCEAYLRGKK